jgi:fatty acid desaturase/membrane-associated phospholipid phosphatase
MLLVGGLYTLATRAPYQAPFVIRPGTIDGFIPFVPAAAFVYVTYVLLLPALIAAARRVPRFGGVFAVAMGCGLANAVIYNLVPTRIAGRTVAPDGSLLAIVQQLDTPLGAIPSGHVALPAAIAVAALLATRQMAGHAALFWRRAALAFALWTAALAASTLLTRQHVAVDVVAGLAFGLAIAVLGMSVGSRLAIARTGPVAVRPALHLPSVAAFLVEWTLMVAAIAAALRWWNGPVIVLAAIVVATRQHAILVLYHDGVHGLVARGRRVNDFVVNSAVGVPLLLPIHLYRALHLSHHRHLGAPSDPERVLLYRGQPWRFRPLPAAALAGQLAGDVLAWNGVVMIVRYLREARGGDALKLPRTRPYPELIVQYAIFFALLGWAWATWPVATTRAALLWFVPYATLTQLLQKIRSFAEHATADADPSLSCSWSPGLLGRLTIWPYNINYHREHHSRPKVPWDRLPATFPAARQRPGRDLVAHLWSGASR